MAKKKTIYRPAASKSASASADNAPTLKDLLSPEIVGKLKAQADEMKQEEANRKEAQRKQAEEARQAEKKRLESDFSHLLENSSLDWKKFK